MNYRRTGVNIKQFRSKPRFETYESVVQYSMFLDDFDHPRNLFLRVPFGKGLLINTFCPVMVCREFEQWLGLLFGHCRLAMKSPLCLLELNY